MLIRSNQVAPKEQYYQDALSVVPTASQTIYHGLALGFATPFVALNNINGMLNGKAQGGAVFDSLSAMEITESTEGIGTGQRAAGYVSNLVGSLFNPINIAAGELGGAAAGRVTAAATKLTPTAALVLARKPIAELLSEPIGAYIPKMIGKEGAEKPLSVAMLSENAINSFGIGAGFGLPQGVADNFNNDTDHIEWGGVAREMGEMGAFGVAIGSIPIAWGILRGKVNRLKGESPTSSITVDDVRNLYESNKLSKEEYEWYRDYAEYKNNPSDVEQMEKLKARASDIVSANGQKVNSATHEVPIDLVTAQDMDNLKSGIADQLASDLPEQYRTALSDFVVGNNLDRHRENPVGVDGIRGYSDFIKDKMERRADKTDQANKILDDHLEKGIKENMPFSQKEIFKHMKQAGFESSHVANLPLVIPENIERYLKINEKINKFKNKLKSSRRKGQPDNKQTVNRIEELESSLPKILTPKEELSHIKNFFLEEKELPNGWQRSKEYHRLIDLAHVWHNARTLLDRVHMESAYEKQAAFKTIVDQIIKAADSNKPKLADHENVVDYLKTRIEGHIEQQESISVLQHAVSESQQVPADSDTILDEQREQFKNRGSADLKKEFEQSSDKFKEFKNSGNILKNLIACVGGSLGG